MNDHSRDFEHEFANRLQQQLDDAVPPADLPGIARIAMRSRARSHSRMFAATTTILAAVVLTMVGIQALRSGTLPVGAGGSAASSTPAPMDEPGSRGPIPTAALRSDGTFDLSLVPDYVPAAHPDGGIAGWMPKELALTHDGIEPASQIPVYADDLKTLVGHMVQNVGFVPLWPDDSSIEPAASPEASQAE